MTRTHASGGRSCAELCNVRNTYVLLWRKPFYNLYISLHNCNNGSRAHAQTGGCTELMSRRLRDYLRKKYTDTDFLALFKWEGEGPKRLHYSTGKKTNNETREIHKWRQRCFKRGFDLVVNLWPEMKSKTLTQPPLCRQIVTAAKQQKNKIKMA